MCRNRRSANVLEFAVALLAVPSLLPLAEFDVWGDMLDYGRGESQRRPQLEAQHAW